MKMIDRIINVITWFRDYGFIDSFLAIFEYFGLYDFSLRNMNLGGGGTDQSIKKIPIFILSYNRVNCLKQLINFLESRDMLSQVIIIDNASTYEPLLSYLKTLNCRVEYLKKNYGHLALWKCHRFDNIIQNEPFVLTDCDVLPCECVPNDFLKYFWAKLNDNIGLTKVGFSLRIDDIPDSNMQKEKVVAYESSYWLKRFDNDRDIFDAGIDTTFALYRPNITPIHRSWWKSARTDYPYTARHLGWYIDSSNLTEEDEYYIKSLKYKDSHWFRAYK